MPINKQTAIDAYNSVNDPSKWTGIIDSPKDVGSWPELKSTPAPADSDHDGMPDHWERKNKLNKENSDDRNRVTEDGYTMLERYLKRIESKIL